MSSRSKALGPNPSKLNGPSLHVQTGPECGKVSSLRPAQLSAQADQRGAWLTFFSPFKSSGPKDLRKGERIRLSTEPPDIVQVKACLRPQRRAANMV